MCIYVLYELLTQRATTAVPFAFLFDFGPRLGLGCTALGRRGRASRRRGLGPRAVAASGLAPSRPSGRAPRLTLLSPGVLPARRGHGN
eukprot:7386588-Prymnesium_polylepis.1